jgi:O-antigen ligase
MLVALATSVLPSSIWRPGYNRIVLICTGLTCILAAYYVSLASHESPRFTHVLVFLLATATLALGIVGVLERFGLILFRLNQGESQIYTFFANRSLYSGVLILILPFSAVVFLFTTRKEIKIVAIIAFALGCLNLLLTQSRASIVAFAAAFAICSLLYARFLAANRNKTIRRTAAVIAAIVVVAVVTLAAVSPLRQKVSDIFDLRHQPRTQAYEIAIGLWEQSPTTVLFGNGLGSFPELYFTAKPAFYRGVEHKDGWDAVHNELLERLVDGGILGLVAYLAFLGFVFFSCVRLIKDPQADRRRRIIALGVLCVLIGSFLDGLLSTNTRVSFTQFLLFSIVGLLDGIAIPKNGLTRTPRKVASSFVLAVIVLISAGAIALPLGRRFLAERHMAIALDPSHSVAEIGDYYHKAADEDPTNVYPKYLLSKYFLDTGQYAESVKMGDKTRRSVENFKDVVLIQGVAALGLNDLAMARGYVDSYLTRDQYDRNGEKYSILIDFLLHDTTATESRIAETVRGDFVTNREFEGYSCVFPDIDVAKREGTTFYLGKPTLHKIMDGLAASRVSNIPVYFFRLNYVLGSIYDAIGLPRLAVSRFISAESEFRAALLAGRAAESVRKSTWPSFQLDSGIHVRMLGRTLAILASDVALFSSRGDRRGEIETLQKFLYFSGDKKKQERLAFLLLKEGRYKERSQLRTDLRTSTIQ